MNVSEDIPVDTSVDPDIEPPNANRRIVGELIEQPENDEPKVTTLSDDERRDFATLMTCGRRSKKIDVMGHSVKIQTLTTADEMRVGLYTKKYLESQLGFQRAYQVAICAAGVREIQGRPLFHNLSMVTSEDEIFDKSVEEISKYYPIVVSQIYQAIMDLEREFAELAIKLGKLSG